MGRPPLPVGTWGNIRYDQLPNGRWRARARFRDYDGRTRDAARVGRTKGAARDALTKALAERTAPSANDLTASTRLAVVADMWAAEKHAEHEGGRLAAATLRRYREVLEDYVLPGLGGLTVAEATVSRLDAFLKATTTNTGAPTARLCRTVLSGMMGLAVRHGAALTNPIRDVAGVTVAKPEPRALTADEVRAVREAIIAWQSGTPVDGKARRGRPPTQDLLDIVDILLATGARIGEALAVRWEDVDLEHGWLLISGTIAKDDDGKFFRQPHRKNSEDWRRLKLPAFAVDALMRRRVAVVVANVHDVVFPSAAGTLRDPGSVRKQITKVLTPHGLGWVTPHSFRRTVATVVAGATDSRTAADQLGNTQEVTERHYIQRINDGPDVRQAVHDYVIG